MSVKDEYRDSTSRSNTHKLTYGYRPLRDSLEASGWRTPQTYCNFYADAGDFPAVYMFMLVDQWDYKIARPAYIGMSTRLAQRWCGHEILRDLEAQGLWVQKWFLETPKAELRKVESALIKKFDPPWNIIGRTRGIVA